MNDNVFSLRKVPENHDEIINILPFLNPINHPSTMFKTSTLNFFKYDEQYRTSQDYALWFKLSRNGCKFHNIQDIIFLK